MESLLASTKPPSQGESEAEGFDFGPNQMRLDARQWVFAFSIFLIVLWLTPLLWSRLERCELRPGDRLAFSLSKDYWLFSRRLKEVSNPDKILLLGDSVLWGEYVAADGTLTHFLNQEAGATNRFVNVALNGLCPLAQEGLLRYYGSPIRHRRVLLQFNPLWLSSPEADLSSDSEQSFNHASLVPQFIPRIPSYRANASQRLGAALEREVGFLQWVNHLQIAFFNQRSIPAWTLEDESHRPARLANARRNPLAQISLVVPSEPANDPQRGPNSPRHKAWSAEAERKAHFEWVRPDASLQWRAFQRTINLLHQRGNEVLVLLGPFNEHILDGESRPGYAEVRDSIASWLNLNRIPVVVPETLPSELYADANHPLTAGYELLAKRLYANEEFQRWAK